MLTATTTKPDTRKFKLTVSYAELEILLQATHSGNAELLDIDGLGSAQQHCRRIRNRVITILDNADKRSAR